MNPPSNNDDQLERLIQRTVRDLPPRRAPASLEARVLAEIARRTAQPWWRKSFVHWPLAARAVFLVVCIGVAKLAFMGGVWVMADFDPQRLRDAFATQFAWMEAGFAVVGAIAGSAEIVLRNIPPLWLYGTLAVFAAAYLTLFGIGAAAYRVFQPQPSSRSFASLS